MSHFKTLSKEALMQEATDVNSLFKFPCSLPKYFMEKYIVKSNKEAMRIGKRNQ
jgi:hypothetical protein